MTNYNYYEAVKADVENWIEDNLDIPYMIECGEFEDLDDIREYLNDKLFIEDSVTGNASGSYTFSTYDARKTSATISTSSARLSKHSDAVLIIS